MLCLHSDLECSSESLPFPSSETGLAAPHSTAYWHERTLVVQEAAPMPVHILPLPHSSHLQCFPGHPSVRMTPSLFSFASDLDGFAAETTLAEAHYWALQGYFKKRFHEDMGTESLTLFIFVFPWLCACQRAIILLPGWNRNSVMHTWGVLSLQ